MFPRAHHESVCKSVQCVRREITDRKTWSPVSLYAFPLKLRIEVGLTFRRYSSSIFICAHIRVLLNRKERKMWLYGIQSWKKQDDSITSKAIWELETGKACV